MESHYHRDGMSFEKAMCPSNIHQTPLDKKRDKARSTNVAVKYIKTTAEPEHNSTIVIVEFLDFWTQTPEQVLSTFKRTRSRFCRMDVDVGTRIMRNRTLSLRTNE